MSLDHKHFSIAEATANQDGKTSASAILGLSGGVVALLGFLIGGIKGDSNLYTAAGALFTVCATLIGFRKSKEVNKLTPDKTDGEN